MNSLQTTHLATLRGVLSSQYVPHLPALLRPSSAGAHNADKNVSRALSAFALQLLSGCTIETACSAVVDDYEDSGIDAIHYDGQKEVLYLVQAKLKSGDFDEAEALKFCNGVRRLIEQDFTAFNAHVAKRQTEIENALDLCSKIQLVVVRTGSSISSHARRAFSAFLSDDALGEDRFASDIEDLGPSEIARGLRGLQAYPRVDVKLDLHKFSHLAEPRQTYFALAKLDDLVGLHKEYGPALYEKNIRSFLGVKTDVNTEVSKTLSEEPNNFLYYNNGVTVLCNQIEPKGGTRDAKKFKIKGFSVVNGAQTIATAAAFKDANPTANISDARVSITLIQAQSEGNFGKSVTKARNHQNPVHITSFAALDDEQERLRRELANIGITYSYKAGSDAGAGHLYIRVEEAAPALALFSNDPRFAVWLKKEPLTLQNANSDRYKVLFSPTVTAFDLANAVFIYRYVTERMSIEAKGYGPERLTYRHGASAFGWILAKQLREARRVPILLEPAKIAADLGPSSDALRQLLWEVTRQQLQGRSPLGIFRTQHFAVPVMQEIMIQRFELRDDAAVSSLRSRQDPTMYYPRQLFDYLALKAPQLQVNP
jgi:hypothetical protein